MSGPPESLSPAQMASARVQRARFLMDANRHDLAANELRGALAVAPEHAEARGLLGFCLARSGEAEEAQREALEAVRLAPDRAYIHRLRGATLVVLNRLDEAWDVLREALRLNPDDAHTHGLVSEIELKRGDALKAVAAAEAGLAIDPEHVNCSNQRLLALHELGRTAEAQAAATEILRRNPENAVAHVTLGQVLMEKDHHAALEHFRTALRISPNYRLARFGLVRALKMQYRSYRLLRRVHLATILFNVVLWMNPRNRNALLPGAARDSAIAVVAVIASVFFIGGAILNAVPPMMLGLVILVMAIATWAEWVAAPAIWARMALGSLFAGRPPKASGRLRYRPLWLVALLGILTQGLYTVFWLLRTWGELRATGGDGMSRRRRFLLGMSIVLGWFVLLMFQEAVRRGIDPKALGEGIAALGWLPVAYIIHKHQRLLVETVRHYGVEGAPAPWVVTTLLTGAAIAVEVEDRFESDFASFGIPPILLCLGPLLLNQVILNAAALSESQIPVSTATANTNLVPAAKPQ